MSKQGENYFHISKVTNSIFNIILLLLSILAIVPFIFVAIISITDEKSISKNGYSFIPEKLSTSAYGQLFKNGGQLLHSYGVSILITVLGVIIGLVLITTYAYVISRKAYPYKKFFTVAALIPMLFSGGMVAGYLVMVRLLGLKDSIFALILPLAMSPFYCFVLKSFFITSVPDAVIESAKIDGASELQTFIKIVIPISKPGIATIALFLTLGYWNDWFNAMLYIDNQKLIPVQYLLMRIENNINYLAQLGSKAGVTSAIASTLPTETVRMAIVVLTVIPIACAYPFFQRYFTGGLTMGAVKE